jgi:hypothetical protein
MHRVHIDQLVLRFKGLRRDRASELSSELPRAVLHEIRRQLFETGVLRADRRLDVVSVPETRLPPGTTIRQASKNVASAAAKAVRNRAENVGGEG